MRSNNLGFAIIVVAICTGAAGCGSDPDEGSHCDALEPNNQGTVAAELDVAGSLEHCSLSDDDDVDVYRVTSPGLGYVTAHFFFFFFVDVVLQDRNGVSVPLDGTAAYWAMEAGEVVEVWVSGSAGRLYGLSLGWTDVSDSYEPNQDMSEAASVSLATSHRATLFAGLASAGSYGLRAFQDYYRLELQQGALELHVLSQLEWPTAIFELMSADGAYVSLPLESVGDTTVYQGDISTPGTYFLRVRAGTIGEDSPASSVVGVGPDVPTFFDESYEFEVWQ